MMMIRTKSPSPRCCSILSRQFDAAGPILANLLLPRPDRTESQWRRRFSVPRKTSRNFDFVPFPFPTIHPRHFYFQNGIYIYIYTSGLESGTRTPRWKKSECLISKVNLPRGLIKTRGSWANHLPVSQRRPTLQHSDTFSRVLVTSVNPLYKHCIVFRRGCSHYIIFCY